MIPRPFGRAAAALACAVVLVGAAACTHGPAKPAGPPAALSSQPVTSSATITAKPVRLKVLVTRVSGRLSNKQRTALQHNVGKAISTYFDAAFLSGSYPRADFHSAFASFPHGLAVQARKDRHLLTNVALGPTTQQVVPKKKAAYLSVLAPYHVAAGVSARIELRLVDERGTKPAKRIDLTGRLMLTRRKKGGWKIFGYHLSRSVSTVSTGSGS